jgi:hypothetical protein
VLKYICEISACGWFYCKEIWCASWILLISEIPDFTISFSTGSHTCVLGMYFDA